ncbi:hypothetical protein [Pandoraea sputorum]|uniref:Uncharacterized protein n=1 Tax=Pandoraea sputorum TaxID=93222 RepID=A0A5E5BIH7_9BURK|nr:hypothetical protein [Pandoraea sputorum]VVE85148.1 hypothetical protein PSP31121_05103 [Pandoraea sputorum]
MSENKTVTFDAETQQVVPKVPTDEMLKAGSNKKNYGITSDVYVAMIAAAPTPAAQSAGQEAIYQYMTEAGDWADTDWMDYQSAEVEKRIVYAAPVNGGTNATAFNAELLKALDFMVNRFEGEFGLKFSQRHALKNARAALAKARGEQA